MRDANGESRGDGMIRRLFTITSAVSLLPCIAAMGLWVRSYFFLDEFKHRNSETCRYVNVVSLRGGLQFASCLGVTDDRFGTSGMDSMAMHGRPWPAEWQILTGFGTRYYGRFLGLRLAYGDLGTLIPKPMPFWSIRVPYWLIVIAFAVPSAYWSGQFLNRLIHDRRVGRGHCVRCGYDLRAGKDRCPECGTPIALKAEATA